MVTFQFVPYNEIDELSSAKRLHKLMGFVKQERIVLLEGRLTKQEEADLIELTMAEIDDRFRGVELAVIYPNKATGMKRLKQDLARILLGDDRQGITILGPASVVKKIKQNPSSVELYTKERRTRR